MTGLTGNAKTVGVKPAGVDIASLFGYVHVFHWNVLISGLVL